MWTLVPSLTQPKAWAWISCHFFFQNCIPSSLVSPSTELIYSHRLSDQAALGKWSSSGDPKYNVRTARSTTTGSLASPVSAEFCCLLTEWPLQVIHSFWASVCLWIEVIIFLTYKVFTRKKNQSIQMVSLLDNFSTNIRMLLLLNDYPLYGLAKLEHKEKEGNHLSLWNKT